MLDFGFPIGQKNFRKTIAFYIGTIYNSKQKRRNAERHNRRSKMRNANEMTTLLNTRDLRTKNLLGDYRFYLNEMKRKQTLPMNFKRWAAYVLDLRQNGANGEDWLGVKLEEFVNLQIASEELCEIYN